MATTVRSDLYSSSPTTAVRRPAPMVASVGQPHLLIERGGSFSPRSSVAFSAAPLRAVVSGEQVYSTTPSSSSSSSSSAFPPSSRSCSSIRTRTPSSLRRSPSSRSPPVPSHTCPTAAYSQLFGGVAVKCRYGDDVSVILLSQHYRHEGLSDDDGPTTGNDLPLSSKPKGDHDKSGEERPFLLRFADLQSKVCELHRQNDIRIIYVDRDGDSVQIKSDASLNYAFDDWRGALGRSEQWTRPLVSESGVPSSWRLLLLDKDEEL